jgi:hypothetical protein
MSNRRDFIKKSAAGAAGVAIGMPALSAKSYGNILGANDRVVLGSVGIRGRGKGLLDNFSKMHKDGVTVKTICDVDTQYFAEMQDLAANNQKGNKPGTVVDMRKMYEDKDIDAVVIVYGKVEKWSKRPESITELFRLDSKTVPSAM